ncbi:PAS domain S-box protein [Winogradskyella maritima]|uniref:histidine kinase n=1 Tax=Winogradskyella maritima TaxID=1517766 RepID=A0ABV8AGR6_9FLAO|nr:PAS domain S-box protein [Winogradskyella maritima]
MQATKSIPIRQKHDNMLLEFIQEQASIGTWHFDVLNSDLQWSSQVKKIHEVPDNYVPDVSTAINFYKKGYSRNKITQLFTESLEEFKPYDVELQIVTAKGNKRWVRAIGKPVVVNNECVKVQGLFQDIDEKTKRAEVLAIKESELRRTFNDALIGMALVDLDGNWLKVNKSICHMLGYTKKELKSMTFMDITHPDDLMKGYRAMFDMVSGKRNHFETEKRYIHKNGHIVWTLLSVSLVRKNNGKPLHFLAQVNDLTQLKNSSKKVLQLLETTEKQNKRLLNFAHIVSHNLRSHYSNLDMLLDIAQVDLPELKKHHLFTMMSDAINHLGETVENLNDVAAINMKRDIRLEPISLLDTFTSVLSSISGLILESKATVCANIDPKLKVIGIPAYLDSIMLNFLTNAVKYKKPDGIANIEVKASEADEFILIEFKDNGMGIDLERVGDKLFGMYKTFHKHEEARGLGLFITRNQIEAIGGYVKVESEVHIGTTFKVYLRKFNE